MIITSERKFGYPVRHKKKVPFNPSISLPYKIMEINTEIFQMEAELDRCILSGQDYQDLITEAFSSNIHLSTSMEGNPLTKDQVKRITRKTFREGAPNRKLDFFSQEIYNHIYAYINADYSRDWTLKTILDTHSILLFGDESARPGSFRRERGIVETNKGEEVFIACPPDHIPEELASLLTWLNTSANALFPVVAAAVFFHEFESIHPFIDGNGRCGRTLFHVLLQHRGLPNSKMCLVEKEVVTDLEIYYDLLARTDFTGDYTELISNFSEGVWRSYKEAVEKFKEKDLLRSELDETSKIILMKAKKLNRPFDLKDVREWLPRMSDYVLRQRINELVEKGAIWTEGKTKGKRFIFADPTRGLLTDYLTECEFEVQHNYIIN